jgi:hypothetical protein
MVAEQARPAGPAPTMMASASTTESPISRY